MVEKAIEASIHVENRDDDYLPPSRPEKQERVVPITFILSFIQQLQLLVLALSRNLSKSSLSFLLDVGRRMPIFAIDSPSTYVSTLSG